MTLSTFHNYTIFPSHHERFNFYIIEQLIAKILCRQRRASRNNKITLKIKFSCDQILKNKKKLPKSLLKKIIFL